MEREGRTKKRDWLKPSKWLEIYTLWAYKRPLLIFLAIIGVLILFVIGVAATNAMELSDTEGDEWLLKKNKHTKRHEAIEEALEDLGSLIVQDPRSVDDELMKLMFIYKAKDDSKNMFTQDNLETMKEVENAVLQHARYTDFCELNYTDPTVPCAKTLSPLHFFFEYNVSNPQFGEQIASPEEGLAALSEDLFENGFFVTQDFADSGLEASVYTRSRFSLGLPVDNRTNSNDEDDEQREFVYDKFLKDLEENMWELLDMEDAQIFRTEFSQLGERGTVEVIFHHFEIEGEEFNRAVVWDFTWAGLSILSVWVYMLIHLGSFFLSVVGIFEIFAAFPVALLFYREIFSIDYFSHLNILIIFVLLGIGADDIFVFTDAFKQSHCIPSVGGNLRQRLSYTALRASKAVFVTSFTTAAAFFATAVSDLMPMQAFGVFAGLCIVALFTINVLLMPPAMVLWAGYTPWCVKNLCCCLAPLHGSANLKRFCPCCTCCHISEYQGFEMPSGEPRGAMTVHAEQAVAAQVELKGSMYAPPEQQPARREGEDKANAVMLDKTADDDVSSMRGMERFFNGPFYNFVKRVRIIIIIIGAVIFGVGLFFITKFEPPKDAEEWWPPYHMFNKFQDLTDRDGPFLSDDADQFTTVHLVWGLEGMDTSGIDIWDASDFGELIYDTKFDMTSAAAQTHMLGICAQARDQTCKADGCDESCIGEDCQRFLVRFDRSRPGSFEPCWIEDMDSWIRSNQSLGFPDGLPVPQDQFIDILTEYRATQNARIKFQEQIGLFGDELRFVQFELDSTYRPPTAHQTAEAVLNEWEDFMDRINLQAVENGAESVSHGYQSGRYSWVWLWTQKGLIDNAKQGVGIVFALAFIVLNIATGNIIITIIAIVTVGGVVTTVLGLGISLIMDWDLGVAESIISVILVGFSMDYTLHLADSYIESEHTDRMHRTRDALTRLGISVTAGAATTLVSGLFLWGAILTFFTKFAFNVTATILASFLWSMLFFPAMCMIFGPEGDRGNWSTIFDCCISRWRGNELGEEADGAKKSAPQQELASVTDEQQP